ncbi:MAG: tetratricopeptide repeat protein [Rickettsiales bacterium]|nr:tetratricopeptide repeat protein [Rickettsiales bacterium]
MFDNITKLLGKAEPKEIEKKKSLISGFAVGLHEKSEQFSKFLGSSLNEASKEYFTIKEKCKDLHYTNFDLASRHLEKGNLSEAIFRFRFVKKFWPNDFDAYYQLAYCLVLKNKPEKAKEVLEELLKLNPNYNPIAKELLEHLNKAITDAKNS